MKSVRLGFPPVVQDCLAFAEGLTHAVNLCGRRTVESRRLRGIRFPSHQTAGLREYTAVVVLLHVQSTFSRDGTANGSLDASCEDSTVIIRWPFLGANEAHCVPSPGFGTP